VSANRQVEFNDGRIDVTIVDRQGVESTRRWPEWDVADGRRRWCRCAREAPTEDRGKPSGIRPVATTAGLHDLARACAELPGKVCGRESNGSGPSEPSVVGAEFVHEAQTRVYELCPAGVEGNCGCDVQKPRRSILSQVDMQTDELVTC